MKTPHQLLKESINAPPKKKHPIKKMGGWQCPECLTLMVSDLNRGDITYKCVNDKCSEYNRKVRV